MNSDDKIESNKDGLTSYSTHYRSFQNI